MANQEEFEKAFDESETMNIIIQSRSGKQYWINRDQLRLLPDGLFYGVPLNPHPRAKRKIYWLQPENVTIVKK